LQTFGSRSEPSEGDSTPEFFLDGALTLRQPSKGYRFSIDAVILASSIFPQPGQSVVDLGTGCGIISMILAYRNPGIRITGVDIQRDLADLAVENVAANHMEDRIRILCKDLKELKISCLGKAVDWVVSNPPFRKWGSGRTGVSHQRTLAMHEVAMDLADLMAVSRRILKTGGHFAIIYPSERISDLTCKMREFNIELKSIQSIHSEIESLAKRVLTIGRKNGRPGVRYLPPLAIYGPDGTYSAEIQAMLQP
jgi:tRNA1Val (adenine37-N6)-methyltransferase